MIKDPTGSIEQITIREQCSPRHVTMTISLAFLAPALVEAAIEGRFPRGVGVQQLRELPLDWNSQFEALGLSAA